ncbi:MAG: Rrf2 family transcriptional regulator [Actinomycetia bacterium]|nr:Rrf2 family transcriptional regulator [Actinomycetes bacterium]
MSQTAEYALRAMAQLALLPEGVGARAKDLADAADIPAHYISKLLRKLVVAGLLQSRKGHGGGFRLSYPPEDISFLNVLEAVGQGVEPDRCSFGWGMCDPNNPCPLHPAWTQLNEAMMEWATETTLADIRAYVYNDARWQTLLE